MIRMGIVGAENTHTAAIARILNVDKQVKGAQVVALWGETEEFAKKAAEAGQVPTIVTRPEEMIGQVDAVMRRKGDKYVFGVRNWSSMNSVEDSEADGSTPCQPLPPDP